MLFNLSNRKFCIPALLISCALPLCVASAQDSGKSENANAGQPSEPPAGNLFGIGAEDGAEPPVVASNPYAADFSPPQRVPADEEKVGRMGGGGYDAGGYGAGGMEGGYGGGGYGGGGYGGDDMGGDYGGEGGYGGEGYGMGFGDVEVSRPSLTFGLLSSDADDAPKITKMTANRVIAFRYTAGALKPKKTAFSNSGYGGGMGMGGYGGMDGGGGYGGDGGYGGMGAGGGYGGYGTEGGGMSGYGGEGGGYGGASMGAEMGYGGGENNGPGKLVVYAFEFERPQVDGRKHIEVVCFASRQQKAFAEKAQNQKSKRSLPLYVKLASFQVDRPQRPGAHAVQPSKGELRLVTDVVKQTVWKESAVTELNKAGITPSQLAAIEKRLKSILTEEYETQLARQGLEITSIERRISALRDELARRRAAKERVVDVKLGKLVLEAQGLLSR